MNNYSNLKKTKKVILSIMVLVLLFCAEGLKKWSAAMPVSTLRDGMYKMLSGWSEVTNILQLNWTQNFLQSQFHNYHTQFFVVNDIHQNNIKTESSPAINLNHKEVTPEINNSKPITPASIALDAQREIARDIAREVASEQNNSDTNQDKIAQADNSKTVVTSAEIDTRNTHESLNKKDTSESNIFRHIQLLGDSMLGSSLHAALKKSLKNVFNDSKIHVHFQQGTGLVRNDLYDWPNALLDVMDEPMYELTLVFIGTNDIHSIKAENQKNYTFGSEGWNLEYTKRLSAFMTNLCTKTKKAWWFSNLPMRDSVLNEKLKKVNQLLLTEIKKSKCVEYQSLEKYFVDKDKNFTAYLDLESEGKVEPVKIRVGDGIHLSQQGSEYYSAKIIERLIYKKVIK